VNTPAPSVVEAFFQLLDHAAQSIASRSDGFELGARGEHLRGPRVLPDGKRTPLVARAIRGFARIGIVSLGGSKLAFEIECVGEQVLLGRASGGQIFHGFSLRRYVGVRRTVLPVTLAFVESAGDLDLSDSAADIIENRLISG
jgi:hypothetical protein